MKNKLILVLFLFISLFENSSSSEYEESKYKNINSSSGKKRHREEPNTIDINFIQDNLSKYTEVANHVKGKNITVFLGNTGVGKSTLINILANFRMNINNGESHSDEVGAASVSSSIKNSVTRYPKHFTSDQVGDMYDLPGFKDTGGTIYDFLNASAIHSVLTSAAKIRVIFVTSHAELKAGRADLAKEFSKTVSMFDSEFLSGSSCMVVVNQIEESAYKNKLEEIKDNLNKIENINKINTKVFFKNAPYKDQHKKTFLDGLKKDLLNTVISLTHVSYNKMLNFSYSFTSEASNDIEKLIIRSMSKVMKENLHKIAHESYVNKKKKSPSLVFSDYLQKKQEKLWYAFKEKVELTEEYKMFSNICNQYDNAFIEFKKTFSDQYKKTINKEKSKEKDETIKEKDETIKEKDETIKEKEKTIKESNDDWEAFKKNAEVAAVFVTTAAKILLENPTQNQPPYGFRGGHSFSSGFQQSSGNRNESARNVKQTSASKKANS